MVGRRLLSDWVKQFDRVACSAIPVLFVRPLRRDVQVKVGARQVLLPIFERLIADRQVLVEVWVLAAVLVPGCRLRSLALALLLGASGVLLGLDSLRPLQRRQQQLVARHLALIRKQVLVLQLLLDVGVRLRLGICRCHQPVDLQIGRNLLLLLLRCRRILLLAARISFRGAVVSREERVQWQATAAVYRRRGVRHLRQLRLGWRADRRGSAPLAYLLMIQLLR